MPRPILKKMKEYYQYFDEATCLRSVIEEILKEIKELDTAVNKEGSPRRRVKTCKKQIEELTKSLAKCIRKYCYIREILRRCLQELSVVKQYYQTTVSELPKLRRLSINIGPESGIDSELLDKLLKKPIRNSVFFNIKKAFWLVSKTANAPSLVDGIKSTDAVNFEIPKTANAPSLVDGIKSTEVLNFEIPKTAAAPSQVDVIKSTEVLNFEIPKTATAPSLVDAIKSTDAASLEIPETANSPGLVDGIESTDDVNFENPKTENSPGLVNGTESTKKGVGSKSSKTASAWWKLKWPEPSTILYYSIITLQVLKTGSYPL